MFSETDKTEIGVRLRKTLKAKNITVREVQDYLALSCVQTVYRWMEGVNIPCIDHLYALSRLTGVSIDYLVTGREVSGKKEREKRRKVSGETLREERSVCPDLFLYEGKNVYWGRKNNGTDRARMKRWPEKIRCIKQEDQGILTEKEQVRC